MDNPEYVFLTQDLGLGKGPFKVLEINDVLGTWKLDRIGSVSKNIISVNREREKKGDEGIPLVSKEKPLQDLNKPLSSREALQTAKILAHKYDNKKNQMIKGKRDITQADYNLDIADRIESLAGGILSSNDMRARKLAREIIKLVEVLKNEQEESNSKGKGSEEDPDRNGVPGFRDADRGGEAPEDGDPVNSS